MLDLNEFMALPAWHERLKKCGLPVLIYGMGDGCEKVLKAFERYGIKCSGIFASDGFVRGREFRGFRVTSLAEAEQEYPDFAVACAFGTSLPDVMQRIDSIAEKHLLVFPDCSAVGDECFDKDEFLGMQDRIMKVYSLLADDASRKTFVNVLRFKISGDTAYLREIFCGEDEPYELLKLGEEEVYCDLGAYTGDTVKEFIAHTGGRYKHIYALEPSRRNFSKCVKNCLALDRISFYNAAASDNDGTVFFSEGAGRQQMISERGTAVSARSLDSILSGRGCSYIKYDVEGADRSALLGSRKTIEQYSPKIRTAVYHRPYDLIDIPLLIHELQPRYKLYLRQQRYYPAWETELIAIK